MTTTSKPLLLQSHHIVDVYCWIDDQVPKAPGRTGRPALLCESEIITLLVWNALAMRQKTLKDTHRFVQLYHWQDVRVPAYQTFVAQCHRALPTAVALLEHLLADQSPIRIMDATMLPVCRLARADHHKTAKNIAAFGKNWQGWHFGFKLHASIALDGSLAGVFFTGANGYDAQAMPMILNGHCRVAVGDTLYGASVMRRKIARAYGTVVIAPAHPKQRKKLIAPWQLDLLNKRSKIESVFDYLKEHMHLVSSFPRSVAGYFLHYVRILLGYQILAISKGG